VAIASLAIFASLIRFGIAVKSLLSGVKVEVRPVWGRDKKVFRKKSPPIAPAERPDCFVLEDVRGC
jgi:hypothetical protein